MNKYFLSLSFLMGLVVLSSNYLVQFPVNYYGLQNILTYGAFTYPISFLVTDVANRAFGKFIAKKVVYFGFLIGVSLTLLVSTNFSDIISPFSFVSIYLTLSLPIPQKDAFFPIE